MKLTNLLGKQVYSLYEGESVGTISGAYYNKEQTRIISFKIFDNEENEFELSLTNIKAMKDCVIITNKNKLCIISEKKLKTPMFKTVINELGEECGKIVDAEIDESGNIINFITNLEKTLSPLNIYDRKAFIYYSSQNIRIANFKPRNKKVNKLENIKVNILNFKTKNENFVPQKIQYNPELIIGKIAKNDLFGANNEIIVKQNQTITEKIIDDASRHNRLNQLYYIAI